MLQVEGQLRQPVPNQPEVLFKSAQAGFEVVDACLRIDGPSVAAGQVGQPFGQPFMELGHGARKRVNLKTGRGNKSGAIRQLALDVDIIDNHRHSPGGFPRSGIARERLPQQVPSECGRGCPQRPQTDARNTAGPNRELTIAGPEVTIRRRRSQTMPACASNDQACVRIIRRHSLSMTTPAAEIHAIGAEFGSSAVAAAKPNWFRTAVQRCVAA